MASPGASRSRIIGYPVPVTDRGPGELLAMLSRTTDFSVGCDFEHKERCHRSVLRQLLVEYGARVE